MSFHQADWLTIGISVLSSGALSAAIAGWISLINGNRQRNADRDRAEKDRLAGINAKTRELAMTLALEEWKHHCKIAENGRFGVNSPDLFVFRYNQILSYMENGTLNEEAMATIQFQTMNLHISTQDAIDKFRKNHGLQVP